MSTFFSDYLNEQLLNESINDKGLFKAIFVIGTPAAGKTYTVSQLSGQYPISIVNTDTSTEYLAKKYGVTVTKDNWGDFRDTATKMSSTMLFNALNGMLPLFVDSTSNDASNILQRSGILESIGYDVGAIYVKTDIDVAIKRAKDRAAKVHRIVDEDFIRTVYQHTKETAAYLATKFSFFKTIENSSDDIGNAQINEIYGKVQNFYGQPLLNPVGTSTLRKMNLNGLKYLVPDIFTDSQLHNKISAWWR